MNKAILILVVATFIVTHVRASEPVNFDTSNKKSILHAEDEIIRNVAYGESSRQVLDIFLPSGRTASTKVVLLIPGGGWIGGDKSGFDGAASIFSDSSVVAFTMNYRYANPSEGVTYVEMLADIDSAISFICSKSDEYIFDPQDICLFGHSAGAHLALLYAYRNNDSRVNNVISLAGPSDLRDANMLSMPTGIMTILYSVVASMDVCKWQDASPVYFTSSITTHLYHGTLDDIIPYQQSEVLFEKIKNLNPKNTLEIIEGGTHGFDTNNMIKAINETVALIKEE